MRSAVAFAPDGRTLATGSVDHTVILWDLADRVRPRQLARLTGHTGTVASVAFAPDGRSLATSGWGKTALLWDLIELNDLRNHPIQHACTLTGRGLNPDEWAQYVSGLPYRDTCAP